MIRIPVFSGLLVGLLMLAAGSLQAQKFKYIDTEYILNQMPAYQSVQQELDDLSKQWQSEIDAKKGKIQDKYEEYQARRPLMSQKERQKMEKAIEKMEKELADYRSKKFGYKGELYKMREEKMRPIQERLVDAVETVAKNQRLDFVYDKAASQGMFIYAKPNYDMSDAVIKKMGLTPGETNSGEGEGGQ